MDFYVIPPLGEEKLMHSGDRYFCLAQLYIEDKGYRKFFNSLPNNAWVTLDNGAGDHDLVDEKVLLEVVKQLQPNEVIPPDILFDSDTTVKNAKSFFKKLQKLDIEVMPEILFCPQGNNIDQWIDCYAWALDQPWIKTIGLSKISVPQAFLSIQGDRGIMESRHNCFNYLKVNRLLEKPLHLLGMGDPREFQYYAIHDDGYIRSSDSCNSIWSAINDKDWTSDAPNRFERIATPKNYFHRQISKSQIDVVENNIDFLKESVA